MFRVPAILLIGLVFGLQLLWLGPLRDPGFTGGVWQGLSMGYAFIAGFFIEGVRIYALSNAGWTYDFGFLIGTALLGMLLFVGL